MNTPNNKWEIEVTVRTENGPRPTRIDFRTIDYANTRLGGCILHYIDGTSETLEEELPEVSKKIRALLRAVQEPGKPLYSEKTWQLLRDD